jgi:hypothetical protein
MARPVDLGYSGSTAPSTGMEITWPIDSGIVCEARPFSSP